MLIHPNTSDFQVVCEVFGYDSDQKFNCTISFGCSKIKVPSIPSADLVVVLAAKF